MRSYFRQFKHASDSFPQSLEDEINAANKYYIKVFNSYFEMNVLTSLIMHLSNWQFPNTSATAELNNLAVLSQVLNMPKLEHLTQLLG